jgi:hypothetical protein
MKNLHPAVTRSAVNPLAAVRGAAAAPSGRRLRFLQALRELDDAWMAAFHETGFGDVYFSRLFTELWLRGAAAIPKSGAYDLVHGVSAQTAMKYVRRAIAEGFLEEVDNPADGRSRLLRMSPLLRERFIGVIDRASAVFERAFVEAPRRPEPAPAASRIGTSPRFGTSRRKGVAR